MRVVVAGAGIGGLAAAIAIGRVGHEVEVLERAPVVGEVGAGVAVWPNGQRALAALGINSPGGLPVRRLEFRTSRGRLLVEAPIADLRARCGHDLLLLHRAELHSLLLEALGRDRVRAAAEVVGVEQHAGAVGIALASGDRQQADALVGADGLRSAVRRFVLGDGEPRYSGATCWRGVAPFPIADGRAINWLGTGAEFGIFPLRDGRAYWFAVANRPQRSRAGGREEG